MNRDHEQRLRETLRPYMKRSSAVGYSAAVFDFSVFIATIGLATIVDQVWLNILFSIIGGTMISTLFVLGHDATHGSLVCSPRRNVILARILLLPTLHNFTLWRLQHNRLHHQSPNVKGLNSWSPMSFSEFSSIAKWKQWQERLYRGGGFGFYYLIERWLKHKLYPGADIQGRVRRRARADFVLVLAWVAVWCFTIVFTGSLAGKPWWLSVFWGFIVPFFVWNCLMGLTVYLQHTHPLVPWFASDLEARQHGGNEEIAVNVKYPRWYGILSHEIMEHPAHHVNPLIPFHRLRAAQEHLNRVLGDEAIVETMGFRYLTVLVGTCKLYDYERREWTDFSGQSTSQAQSALPWLHARRV